MTELAPNVIVIPPNREQVQTVRRQLRVAAYCRVSTEEEEQISSYEAQKAYYTDKIMSNRKWTMVGLFADAIGIIGANQKTLTQQGGR